MSDQIDFNKEYIVVDLEIDEDAEIREGDKILRKDDLKKAEKNGITPLHVAWVGNDRDRAVAVWDDCGHTQLLTDVYDGDWLLLKHTSIKSKILYKEKEEWLLAEGWYKDEESFHEQTGHKGQAEKLWCTTKYVAVK